MADLDIAGLRRQLAMAIDTDDTPWLVAAAVNAIPALLDIAEASQRPASEEVDARAGSLELYANGIAELVKVSRNDEGWLTALSAALRDTAAMLRSLDRSRPPEATAKAVEALKLALSISSIDMNGGPTTHASRIFANALRLLSGDKP